MLLDTSNSIFQLALQFVNRTGRHIFLTGKAGTGKTTFLKYVRDNCFKKMAIVAPTGVAAINAGAVTMHSFFQLPFGPYLPSGPGLQREDDRENASPQATDQLSLLKNIRFNSDKRELLKELELLVIDEVSMVRADTLDAVDAILRHYRQQPLSPFGGVQVLYIGDLYQLPPVVRKEEWELLRLYYKSPFFFDAWAIQQFPPISLELKKIYRQKDENFIHILNNIRNDQATPQDMQRLHEYYRPGFQPPANENYITLTSHNIQAEAINRSELTRLPGKQFAFEATVTGEFNDKSYPAEKIMHLKQRAQIMFIKNDKGEERRFFNGKIATIKSITGNSILVCFPGGTSELLLEKETWKNIRYNYNREKDSIEEEVIGTFSQYPIRLAWAITIHKSQGLTFEKAIIDAGAAFAAGQVYVALSRLTSIEGLVLLSRIHPASIGTDERVIAFTEKWDLKEEALESQLEKEQKEFIHYSLKESFNWSRLVESLAENCRNAELRQIPAQQDAVNLVKKWLNIANQQQKTAAKFSKQLEQLLMAAEEGGYRELNQRMQAAADYFARSLEDELIKPIIQHKRNIKAKKGVKGYLNELEGLKMLFTRKKQQIGQAAQIVSGLEKGQDPDGPISLMPNTKKEEQGWLGKKTHRIVKISESKKK